VINLAQDFNWLICPKCGKRGYVSLTIGTKGYHCNNCGEVFTESDVKLNEESIKEKMKGMNFTNMTQIQQHFFPYISDLEWDRSMIVINLAKYSVKKIHEIAEDAIKLKVSKNK